MKLRSNIEPATAIQQYLRVVIDITKDSTDNPHSLEGILLAHGRSFIPQARPAGVPKMTDKECFNNAWQLCERHPEYRYVEGYATSEIPIPLLHAWCIDAQDRVIDPTWPDPANYTYFGLVLDPMFCRKRLLATQYYGILPNLWLANGIEELREILGIGADVAEVAA